MCLIFAWIKMNEWMNVLCLFVMYKYKSTDQPKSQDDYVIKSPDEWYTCSCIYTVILHVILY